MMRTAWRNTSHTSHVFLFFFIGLWWNVCGRINRLTDQAISSVHELSPVIGWLQWNICVYIRTSQSQHTASCSLKYDQIICVVMKWCRQGHKSNEKCMDLLQALAFTVKFKLVTWFNIYHFIRIPRSTQRATIIIKIVICAKHEVQSKPYRRALFTRIWCSIVDSSNRFSKQRHLHTIFLNFHFVTVWYYARVCWGVGVELAFPKDTYEIYIYTVLFFSSPPLRLTKKTQKNNLLWKKANTVHTNKNYAKRDK